MRYIAFSFLPTKVNVIESNNLSKEEVGLVINNALPYGSDWELVTGARSIKLFPFNKNETCVSYTVITKTKDKHLQEELHCLAILMEKRKLHLLIRKDSNWINRIFSEKIEEISLQRVKKIMQSSIITRQSHKVRPLGFWMWLKAQLHLKIFKEFYFYNVDSWLEQEEYARKVYLAIDWQVQIFNIEPLSFTTFSLSSGESTKIALIAIPAAPTI